MPYLYVLTTGHGFFNLAKKISKSPLSASRIIGNCVWIEEEQEDPVVNREETFPRDCYSGLSSIQQPEARGQFSQFYAQENCFPQLNACPLKWTP